MNEMLNQTKDCEKCNAIGYVLEDPKNEESKTQCPHCLGSGAVVDNRLPEILISYGIKGSQMAKCAMDIYKYHGVKLQESYDRGIRDGKDEVKLKKN